MFETYTVYLHGQAISEDCASLAILQLS